MKFKVARKGKITQYFGGNANPLYRNAGLNGHTGIDWTLGYGKGVTTDNGGYVYKTYTPERPSAGDGFTGVYLLVPMGGEQYMEVCLGHLSKVFVEVGETIPEDYVVGQEGNNGDVYQGGVYYPDGAPNKGTKGSHVHENWRPVRRVKKLSGGKHYLNSHLGGMYQDTDGYYYEVVNTNEYRGCIDPLPYSVYETTAEKIKNAYGVVHYLKSKLTKLLNEKR